MNDRRIRIIGRCAAAVILPGLLLLPGGCEQDREIMDVEAPGVELEVREDAETGELTIDGRFDNEKEHSTEDH